MSTEKTIQYLLEQIQNGTATEAECSQLKQLISDDESGDLAAAANVFFSGREDVTSETIAPTPYWQAAVKDILSVDKVRPVHSIRRYWMAAAAILLLLAAGAYIWQLRPADKEVVVTNTTTKDIAPGKAGAVLTLADGTEVVLDSVGNGVIANQQGAKVMLQGGQLAYYADGSTGSTPAYNTMTTPKGRQYNLVLPDGTGVWLNAASSIRFPTRFTGNERRVDVTGEVYFEVAHNAAMPFRARVNDKTEVEVLGTHFNIHAYKDEAGMNTTLLEGSVKIAGVTLKPGQQASISNNERAVHVIDHADIDKIMAWKNGLFNFNGASLPEVMKQLERWYDIEVVYEKGIPDITFGGKMTKGVSLNGVLIALEKSEVHFRLEGRKLIVMP